MIHTHFAIRERVYAPGMRMPRHAHDFSNVTVVLSGEIEEIAEEGRYRGRSCSVVLKPAGCEHENRVSGIGARTLTIELTGGRVADEIAARRWAWFDAPEVVRAAVALRRASAEESEGCAWALLAALPHVISSVARDLGGGAACKATAPSWIAAAIEVIEQRFDEPLRLESLAHDFGFHPVYFSRAFHRHTGTPLHDYVRTVRLRHARHLLATSKRSVTAIAVASGFYDSSHFSRTFSNALGVTPKKYRSLCGEVQSVQSEAAQRS
ncbi:MAG TPA: helix-turn-helix transcriptional regulator [Thermoanaerobaculia bacterium]|nr:helix-turn-helix transcriptional regulator [Thermoanaerobaculia bacterium]